MLYRHFEDRIYDMYIFLDIVDKVHNISGEVVYILTFLHSLIFLFVIIGKMRYNKEKII